MDHSPLEGIRVIDCTIWYQGPFSSAMLAELGADVIHIEQPGVGDPTRGSYMLSGINSRLPDGNTVLYELANRNKRSMTIDIAREEGREVIHKLVARSDVFLHNLRPKTIERWQLDYPSLSRHNPKLIYVNSTGFGTKGPDANRPVLDNASQAESGFMSITGPPEAYPTMVNTAIGDQITAILTAYSVLAAIVSLERFGVGQEVEVSQLGSLVFLQTYALEMFLRTGHMMPRLSRTQAPSPLWNHYPCKDGRYISFALAQSDRVWPEFCSLVGIAHLQDDPRFNSAAGRREHCAALIAVLDSVFATRDASEWVQVLAGSDKMIFSVVNTHADVIKHPQVLSNEVIVDVDHPTLGRIKTVRTPIRMDKTPLKMPSGAPELGQHTEELLLEIGYDWTQIGELREKGLI